MIAVIPDEVWQEALKHVRGLQAALSGIRGVTVDVSVAINLEGVGKITFEFERGESEHPPEKAV